ncbi:S-layer homology domain-containing protein [Sporosarcina highlanderae]|uniref:S-layer homology domain-containing protein n=1 Tax=Sporosarcina highlanderae TaxID=3035916 RepID=A0ABT8JLC2_9BACL|nr:S-layer homology domain-containing protein [Sporosarcina highlanderae]MDN4605949.1 S-layer homology domain-containing protein [Sporosarcina highlanderae]
MAHQPKAYKKFVATAATATLVASAIVPVASAAETKSFTDVSSAYADAVNYLVAEGITQGTSATTFGTTQNITRGDAAVFIARALKLDVDNAKDQGFKDLNSRVKNAVNAIVEAKIAGGKSETSFAPDANITRQEMAKMLANAYGLTAKENANFTDVNSNWIGYVSALKEAGITLGKTDTTFAPTANLTRGEFALFMYRAEGTPVVGEVALSSAKAVNAKTIELTFNKAVDTEKAKIEVLRGTFKQNVTAQWAEDNKSVQLVSAGNFQAADYTVTVSGLAEKDLTASVKIEAQKIASIQVLSDVAVLSSNPVGGLIPAEDTTTTATVGYVVKDQYGTDITETTPVTTNANTVTANKGKITLSGLAGKRVGDLVPVVLVHANSGTTTTATVKLSAAAAVADITVDGLYNAKGEKVELTDATKADSAYLVVNLKDQYGNALTPGDATTEAAGVIVTNTNPLVLKLNSGDKIKTATINGKKKYVLDFAKVDAANDVQFRAGSAELLFITTMDGKTFKHTVSVSETKTTDSVSVSTPEHSIINEDVLLPITVLDKEGNVITDKDLLTHATKGIKVNGNALVSADKTKLTVKDGQVYYNLGKATGAADNYVTATVTTATHKIATVTYKLSAQAKPVAVRGLKNPLIVKAGQSSAAIDFSKVNVEDQYGRTMTATTWGAAGANYSIGVKPVSENNEYISVNTTTNVVTAKLKNGTSNIVLYLKDSNITDTNNELKEVANSAVQQQVRVTDGTEYSDYEIVEIGKVQAANTAEAAGAYEFTVNGLLNGGKVALDPSEYTVKLTGGKGTATVNGDEITVNVEDMNTNSGGTAIDTEFTLRVTIETTGKTLEQKFVVSKDNKLVEDFFFTTAAVNSNYFAAKGITEAIVTGGTYTVASAITKEDETTTALNVATVDQYDNVSVVSVATASVLTIVPEKAGSVVITGNGTHDAKAVLADGVNEAVITVKVKVGAATKELKVTLKK